MVWLNMAGPTPAQPLFFSWRSLNSVASCTGNTYLPDNGDEGGAEIWLHLMMQSTHPLCKGEVRGEKSG